MEIIPISIEIRTSRGTRVVRLRAGRSLTVGSRAGSVDVVIEHEPDLESHHVTLRAEGETVTIEDAGTVGGTFLNGRRIRRRELSEGDSVQAGGVSIRRVSTASHEQS